MTRSNFQTKVKVAAFERCNGFCEGENCGAKLTVGKFHYDHRIPDGLGGEPTLENCQVLCVICHGEKTGKQDVPQIAKAKRRHAKHVGAYKSRNTIPGSKASGWKKKMNGEVVRR